MTIKKLTAILLCVVLSACASSSPYKPAKNASSTGYTERQITDDRWRVNFRIRNDRLSDAQDYALLRAGELTLAKGHTWFEVIDRSNQTSDKDRGGLSVGVGTSLGRRCGLFGCGSGTGIGVGVGTSSDRDYSVAIIEIKMGEGEKPEGTNIYDARSLVNTLRTNMIDN